MAILLGVMGNSFVGLVGHKALGMSDNMVAVLQAMSMAGFIVTGIGTSYLFKYSKPRSLRLIFSIVSVLLTSVFFLPYIPYSEYVFILQIFLIQTALAFGGSLRSAIWRKNYPDEHRAKMLVMIYLTITMISSIAVMVFSSCLDMGVSFNYIYLFCAVMAIATAWGIGLIRVSGEKRDIVSYRAGLSGQSSAGQFFTGVKVLKDDARFRRFLSWQMLNGLCCLSIEAALVIILTRIIDGRADITNKWLVGGTTLAALPQFVCALSSTLWARYFDRKDIFIIRAIAAGSWSSSRLVLAVGLFTGNLYIIVLSRVVTGVSMGLGQLAWRLGHMTFAPPEKDGLYMGAHQMLTGIRGMAAPFIGIYLLKYDWVGPNATWLVLLSAAGMAASGLAFLKMRKDYSDLVRK